MNGFQKAGFPDVGTTTEARTASGDANQVMANDQALHDVCRNLQGDETTDNVELDYFLYADSVVVATEELTNEVIASDFRGDLQH